MHLPPLHGTGISLVVCTARKTVGAGPVVLTTDAAADPSSEPVSPGSAPLSSMSALDLVGPLATDLKSALPIVAWLTAEQAGMRDSASEEREGGRAMPDGLHEPDLANTVAPRTSVATSPALPTPVSGGGQAPAPHPVLNDTTARNLAYGMTAGFFVFLFLLCFVRPPDSNLAMLNIVLGSLGTAWVGSMAYYFGATQAGRTKEWRQSQGRDL